jgi:hypothetical protein
MKTFNRCLLVAFLAIISSSCTQRLVDFTIISTKNIDLSRAGALLRSGRRATGEDAKLIVIVFPTGIPSAKEAVDRAIESVPGGIALVDGVLTSSFFYIPYLIGETKYIVEGTVLVDPTLAKITAAKTSDSLGGRQADHRIITCDKHGKVVESRPVSKREYLEFKKEHGLLASY